MWLEKAANLWMAALDQPAAMGKHWRITGSTTATWEGLSSYRLGGLCSGRARVVMEPTARAGWAGAFSEQGSLRERLQALPRLPARAGS